MKRDLKLFQKLCSFPFLLIFVAFLFPLVNVSCSEKAIMPEVLATPNVYELAFPNNMESLLEKDVAENMADMKNNAQLKEFLFQDVQTTPAFLPIIFAVALGAIFAFFTPAGSLAMALASFVSLWVFIYNLGLSLQRQHLTLEPAVGAYCISFLLAIAIAMNLTVLIKGRRQKKDETLPK